jgi:hypothetical protein
MNDRIDKSASQGPDPGVSGTPAGWERWVPGPAELVFLHVLFLVLIGGRFALLNDPGIPWHLRLGRDIARTGAVPRQDHLTYTKTGTPWVDQSWGFDLLLATVVDHAGWSMAIGLAAIGLGLIYAGLTRALVNDGFPPLVAVVVGILATSIGSLHFLLRPHLFTLGFVLVAFRICQRQHERGGWGVLWLAPLTAVLANLHGGFLALPFIGVTSAIGEAVSGPWSATRRSQVFRFSLAAACAGLAAVANPYGIGLYQHVVGLLFTSGVTGLISEYQPIPFGQPQVRIFEMALLGLVALPVFSARRIDRYQLVHLLAWLHLSLSTVRNAPLFALAAAPPLATLLAGLPFSMRTSWSSQTLRHRPVWAAAAAMIVLFGLEAGVSIGGFNPRLWPLSALPVLDRQPASARLFHEQDWGGLIEAECASGRRTYLDDRFELYGKEAILEYLDVLTGGPAWDLVRDRDRIDLVWLKPKRGLARRLLADPNWIPLHQDKVSILFARRPHAKSSDEHPAETTSPAEVQQHEGPATTDVIASGSRQ